MRDVVVVPIVLQVAVPIALMCWLAFGRAAITASLAADVIIVAAYFLAIGVAALWLVIAPPFLAVYALLLLLALGYRLRSRHTWKLWPESRGSRIALAVRAALAVGCVALAAYALSGRRPMTGNALELQFPLEGGPYLVVNGGSRKLLNAHLMTMADDDRFRPYRGQSFGLDIVKLNDWGVHASSPFPRQPAAYAIFDEPITAPCAGTVILAADGFGDMHPPDADRAHMAGNHVIIECDGRWVVIGHMRQGSVRVGAGDVVGIGQRLGSVGNSGNTVEPHLHIHAQTPGTRDAPMSGEPVPMLFGGRYLARNSRVYTGSSGN